MSEVFGEDESSEEMSLKEILEGREGRCFNSEIKRNCGEVTGQVRFL